MREIFFLATLFISVTVVYTDNFCTGERAGGLLALTLCKLHMFFLLNFHMSLLLGLGISLGIRCNQKFLKF